MASISIRNPEDDLKRRQRLRAGEHGRSMEEEAARNLAIARAHGATVATRDMRDYQGCGIAVIDPWWQTGVM